MGPTWLRVVIRTVICACAFAWGCGDDDAGDARRADGGGANLPGEVFISDDPTGGGEPRSFGGGPGGYEEVEYADPETYVAAPVEGVQAHDFVQLDGQRLYVAGPSTGLAVMDVADPAAPRLVAQRALSGRATGLLVHDGYAFVLTHLFERTLGASERATLSVFGIRNGELEVLSTHDFPVPVGAAWIDGNNLLVIVETGRTCPKCGATEVTVTSFHLGELPSLGKAVEAKFADVPRVGIARGAFYVASGSGLRRVDVSPATGGLTVGKAVRLQAQVLWPQQMSVTDGTLVVANYAQGDQTAVALETFDVSSSRRLVPAGRIANAARLASLACAGSRCYARTGWDGEQGIATIDLRNRKAPVLSEEFPTSHVYLLPDTFGVFGFGGIGGVARYAPGADGNLKRVVQAGGWAQLAETDLEHIRQAVRWFSVEGLATIPVRDSGSGDAGVRLFDVSETRIAELGLAAHDGAARAFPLSGEHLLVVAGDGLSTFDIRDRGAPRRLDARQLGARAHLVARVGNYLASLDFGGRLTIRPFDRDRIAPVGALELGGEVSQSMRLMSNGQALFVSWMPGWPDEGQREFAVVDVGESGLPKLRGQGRAMLPAPVNKGEETTDAGAIVLPQPNSAIGTGVLVGRTFVLPEYFSPRPRSRYDEAQTRATATLYAVDLSDPQAIGLVSEVAIDEGYARSGLFVDGSVVFMTHAEPEASEPEPHKLRYFVDRVDYADPAHPRRLDAVNVPGALLAVLPGGRRIVTVDHRREELTVPDSVEADQFCSNPFGGYASANVPQGTETCVRVYRTLRVVELGERGARVVASYEPKGEAVGDVAVGDDRIWLLRRAPAVGDDYPVRLETLHIEKAALTSASTFDLPAGANSRLFAEPASTTVLVTGEVGDSGSDEGVTHRVTAIIDTADASAPRLVGLTAPAHAASITSGAAIVAAGVQGSVIVPLPVDE